MLALVSCMLLSIYLAINSSVIHFSKSLSGKMAPI